MTTKYKCQDILENKANDYIEVLNQEGVEASIKMFRDYNVKLSIIKDNEDLGCLNLYCNKKKKFKVVGHELKENNLMAELLTAWNKLHGKEEYKPSPKTTLSEYLKNIKYEIYVDGSFIKNQGIGYGIVIVDAENQEVIDEFCGKVSNDDFKGSLNVTGEIYGVIEALKWCERNKIDKVAIFYDYKGLKCWATGEWKANKKLTKEYKKFINNCEVKIKWNKVKAHSGNKFNERADELAKKGTGTEYSTFLL